MGGRRVEIHIGAFVIEVDAHIWISLCCFDDGRIQRGAADRVDAIFRIDIVRAEMQRAGFIVNHSAAHRDRVVQCFISHAELLERINAPGRNCQVD